MMSDAALWLLDEPFNGLDAPSAELFRAALNDHVAKGGMAAIASHYNVEPPQSGALRRITLGAA
jgi:heme exporter protein A